MAQKDFEENEKDALRERSGKITSTDKFVAFIYQLIRDHVLLADVERCVLDNTGPYTDEFIFTNGYLANYAKDVVKRLTE